MYRILIWSFPVSVLSLYPLPAKVYLLSLQLLFVITSLDERLSSPEAPVSSTFLYMLAYMKLGLQAWHMTSFSLGKQKRFAKDVIVIYDVLRAGKGLTYNMNMIPSS